MAMDALKKVKLAEDEAEDIKRQAAQKAREIILAAERAGEELLRNVTKEAQNYSKVLIEEAEREAHKDIALLHETHEKEKQVLISNANDGMKSAVSLIVGKVVALNGNH